MHRVTKSVVEFSALLFLFTGIAMVLLDVAAPLLVFGAVNQEKNNCAPCKNEWIRIDKLFGYECRHNPSLNPNCPQGKEFDYAKDCWELNGNKNASNGKKCECFKCGMSDQCEGQILKFVSWCGKLSVDKNGKELDGKCDLKAVTVKPAYPIRYERPAVLGKGKKCEPGGGFKQEFWCGFEKKLHFLRSS